MDLLAAALALAEFEAGGLSLFFKGRNNSRSFLYLGVDGVGRNGFGNIGRIRDPAI